MKYYIVIGEDSNYHIIGAQGFTPNNVVCAAPDNEEISWLEIVDVIDPDTQEIVGKQAIVNETTKAQVLADRAAQKVITDQKEALQLIVSSARKFGDELMTDFVMQNIVLGITQANMTETVLDIMSPIENALRTGSLYVAISRIKAIPAESKDATFITNARLLEAVNKIETYLNIPLSQNL